MMKNLVIQGKKLMEYRPRQRKIFRWRLLYSLFKYVINTGLFSENSFDGSAKAFIFAL
jgi:hypothetical protein